jgi:hypothetical protein
MKWQNNNLNYSNAVSPLWIKQNKKVKGAKYITNCFAFTPIGANVDESVNDRNGPYQNKFQDLPSDWFIVTSYWGKQRTHAQQHVLPRFQFDQHNQRETLLIDTYILVQQFYPLVSIKEEQREYNI